MTLPKNVLIRYATIDACPRRVVGSPRDWLGADEQRELERFGDAKRRRQWLAGRVLAKRLVGEATGVEDFGEVQILSRDARGRGVRPRVFVGSRELDGSLSISHSDRGVLAALAPAGRFSVGVDLAASVRMSEGFARLWFTAVERRWIADDPRRRAALTWALKEAIYKAAHRGQSWDPRQVEILPRGGGFACRYRGRAVDARIVRKEIDAHTAVVVCLSRGGALPVAAGESSREETSSTLVRNAS